MKDLEPEVPVKAALGFLIHRNCEVVDVCYFKLLSLGVISYVATDNYYMAYMCNVTIIYQKPFG